MDFKCSHIGRIYYYNDVEVEGGHSDNGNEEDSTHFIKEVSLKLLSFICFTQKRKGSREGITDQQRRWLWRFEGKWSPKLVALLGKEGFAVSFAQSFLNCDSQLISCCLLVKM